MTSYTPRQRELLKHIEEDRLLLRQFEDQLRLTDSADIRKQRRIQNDIQRQKDAIETWQNEFDQIEAAKPVSKPLPTTDNDNTAEQKSSNARASKPIPPEKWTGKIIQQFYKAVLDAYTYTSLERVLQFEMGKRLDHYVRSASFQDVVFELISSAQRQGWMKELLEAVHKHAPTNVALAEFYRFVMGDSAEANRDTSSDNASESGKSKGDSALDRWRLGPSPRIFLSYSRVDMKPIQKIYTQLIDAGFNVWWDDSTLPGGAVWEEEIESAVTTCDKAIVCISKKAIGKRGYFQKEMRMLNEQADFMPDGEHFVIPLRLDDCNMPRALKEFHRIDYFGDSAEAFKRLVSSLRS